MTGSPVLVDFALRLVNSVLLPNRQVKFFVFCFFLFFLFFVFFCRGGGGIQIAEEL